MPTTTTQPAPARVVGCALCEARGWLDVREEMSGGYTKLCGAKCTGCDGTGRWVTAGALPGLREVVARLRALVADDLECAVPSLEPGVADEIMLLADAVEVRS